jgi:hypothetical protein
MATTETVAPGLLRAALIITCERDPAVVEADATALRISRK